MIQKIKRPVSILLALLMVVGMFAVVPISAGATVYTENSIGEFVTTGDIIHLQGDYIEFDTYSVVLKGGTYKVAGSNEVAQSDIQLGEAWSGSGVTVHDDGFRYNGTKYVPVDANGYESGSWLVLDVNNDDGVITFRGMCDYYLAGTMNMWDTDDGTYELAKNPGNTDEYMLLDFAADANTEFKVVGVGEYIASTNNFTLNDAGTYDIYFRPNGGGNTADGWVDGKVFANNFRPASSATYVAQIGDTKYETLEAAFVAANDGATITVLADSAGNGIKVPQGKFATGLTVDFAGHTYTVDGETVGSTGTETNGFQLLKGNKITFKNGTITSAKAKILVQNYSDLTLDGMTLTLNNPNYTGAYTLSDNNGDVVINNTTINANPEGGFAFDVCRFSSYPSVHVTVKGDSLIKGDVEISASKGDAKEGFSLTLESGTMTGNIVVDASAQALVGKDNKVTKANSFTQEAPAGFRWVGDGETQTLAAIPYVAQIGNTKYETLEAAFAAAADGDTITLLADCNGNGIIVPQGKFNTTGLTVDFAGKTYTVDGDILAGSTGTKTQAFQLLKDNKVTFKNGTVYSEKAKMIVQNYSDLTLDGMTLTIDNPNYAYAYTLSNNNGSALIKDTTINANPAGGFAFDVCRYASYPSINVTVTGDSVINGNVEVDAGKGDAKDGFSLNLESGTLNGVIKLTNNAKTAMAATPDKAEVDKATSFTAAAPAGYMWVADTAETGTQTLAKAVAKIGDTTYATLEAAFAAAQDGNTITLLADCTGNGIKAPQGKFGTDGLTVDFAGHTYTIDGTTVGSTGTETNGFQLLKDNKITFVNGKLTTTKAKILVQNYSNLTLDGMTLDGTQMLGDGNYVLSNNNGNVVIDDTTITAREGCIAFDVCRYASYPSVNVTVTGNSTINGDVEVFASKSDPKDGFSLKLLGGTLNGNIVVDQTAKNAITNAPAKAAVTKANTFNQTAPEGFEWKDNGNGTSTLVSAEIFKGHNISVADGDIHLNFFVDKNAIPGFDNATSVKVKFTWDTGNTSLGTPDFSDVELKGMTADVATGYLKAKCTVNAAQMACPITATIYVDGNALNSVYASDKYSVKQYAETMLGDTTYGPFLKAMLNYGYYAQKVFADDLSGDEVPNAVDLTQAMAAVNSDTIRNAIQTANGEGGATIADLKNIGTAIGGKWYNTSVIFLSQNTIRHYFDDLNESGIFVNTDMKPTQNPWIYYTEKTGITPDDLDTLYTFNVKGKEFKYSVLSYAADVLESGKTGPVQDLVKALYLYNQAANDLFKP